MRRVLGVVVERLETQHHGALSPTFDGHAPVTNRHAPVDEVHLDPARRGQGELVDPLALKCTEVLDRDHDASPAVSRATMYPDSAVAPSRNLLTRQDRGRNVHIIRRLDLDERDEAKRATVHDVARTAGVSLATVD